MTSRPASGCGASPIPPGRRATTGTPRSTSVAVASRGVSLVLDPLAPPPGERALWERIEALRPEAAVILKPDHVRDVDLFVRWYGCRAYGPSLFWRDDVPRTELEAIHPGGELPGGLLALHDGRGMQETPVYLPEQRALVFADAMTAPGGVLRVWATPWHEAAGPAGAARAAGAAVRARDRVARRAGARPARVRGRPRTRAVVGLGRRLAGSLHGRGVRRRAPKGEKECPGRSPRCPPSRRPQ